MSSALPLKIKSGKLPLNYTPGTARQFFRDIIRRTKMYAPDDKVFVGRNSGSFAAYDTGFQLGSGGMVYRWAPEFGSYAPLKWQIANNGHTLTLGYNATDDFVFRNITFPNATGTVALLIDAIAPRATQLLTGSGTVNLDGGLGESFFFKLSGNVTIGTITINEGQEIFIGIVNIGTTYTVDWTGTDVIWADSQGLSSGSPPTQPIADVGGAGYGLYILRGISDGSDVVIYGEFIDNTPFQPSGMVDVGGDPPKDYGGSGSTPSNSDRQKNLP